MRHDAIELERVGLATRAAEDRVARLGTRLKTLRPVLTDRDRGVDTALILHDNAAAVDVIDAAFANLAGTSSKVARIDPASHSCDQAEPDTNTSSGLDHVKREIVADLSAQLLALDHQRERLAALLRSIDGDVTGE
jgi:hypothetical protein